MSLIQVIKIDKRGLDCVNSLLGTLVQSILQYLEMKRTQLWCWHGEKMYQVSLQPFISEECHWGWGTPTTPASGTQVSFCQNCNVIFIHLLSAAHPIVSASSTIYSQTKIFAVLLLHSSVMVNILWSDLPRPRLTYDQPVIKWRWQGGGHLSGLSGTLVIAILVIWFMHLSFIYY